MVAVTVKAKELRFAVELSASHELRDENGVVLAMPPESSPEHLVLAALVRCALKSLHFHARRSDTAVRSTAGTARTLVTKRATDDPFAMVETEVGLDVELDPEPPQEELAELLALAERDCFVGSSLTARPNYRWSVNGRTIGS